MSAELDLTQFEGHTPGEWKAEDGFIVASSDEWPRLVIADVHCTNNREKFIDRDKANGRLLAAAPALFALCKSQQEEMAKKDAEIANLTEQRGSYARETCHLQELLNEAKAERDALKARCAEMEKKNAEIERLEKRLCFLKELMDSAIKGFNGDLESVEKDQCVMADALTEAAAGLEFALSQIAGTKHDWHGSSVRKALASVKAALAAHERGQA